MTSSNIYEKYDIPVPVWRMRSAKNTSSAAATAPAPSSPRPAPPVKQITYTQQELDAILKAHPTLKLSYQYAFTRREAEVVAAASVGRAELPWADEWTRSTMEDAAKRIVKEWEVLDKQVWYDSDDELETQKASKKQIEQLPFDNHIETWEELDEQKRVLEMAQQAGWVEPDIVPEYECDATTSLEENHLDSSRKDDDDDDDEREGFLTKDTVDVSVSEADKDTVQLTNSQSERNTKTAVSVDSDRSLFGKTGPIAEPHLEADISANETSIHNCLENGSDLDYLFEDAEDGVEEEVEELGQEAQEVAVDGVTVANSNDLLTSSRESEVILRPEVCGNEGGKSATAQEHAGLADAAAYVPAALPQTAARQTHEPQPPNDARNPAVSQLPPDEAAAKFVALIKNSRLTFPEIPIPQSVHQTMDQISAASNPGDKTSDPLPLKDSRQPDPRVPFGPSRPIQLTPAPKRGPKQISQPVPVLPPNLDQRCRQRLNAGVKHIREFFKRKIGAVGPMPQDGKLVKKLEAIQRVMSTQEWRVFLERKIWEDGRQPMGSDSNSLVPPAHIGQGLADDVDTAMPDFLKQAIRIEKANEKRSKASVASPGLGSSNTAAHAPTPYVGSHPMGPASQMMHPPATGSEPNPGFAARYPPPPQSAPTGQMPPPQIQPTSIPSGSQQVAFPQLSPTSQAILSAWELEYFANQDRFQANVRKAFGPVIVPNPVERQIAIVNFRNSFYEKVAEFGETRYIECLRQATKREDLFGNHPLPRSSGTKRRANEGEGKQVGYDTKRSRQQ